MRNARRTFASILTDKIAKKYDGKVKPEELAKANDIICKVVADLDAAKVAMKKASKKNYKLLAKFTKEELVNYLATLA